MHARAHRRKRRITLAPAREHHGTDARVASLGMKAALGAKRVRILVKTVAVASDRGAAHQESHHGKRAAELEVMLSKTGTLVTNKAVSGGVGCGKTCRCPP